MNFDMSEGRGYLQLRSTPFKEGRHQYDYQLSLTRCLGHESAPSAVYPKGFLLGSLDFLVVFWCPLE